MFSLKQKLQQNLTTQIVFYNILLLGPPNQFRDLEQKIEIGHFVIKIKSIINIIYIYIYEIQFRVSRF